MSFNNNKQHQQQQQQQQPVIPSVKIVNHTQPPSSIYFEGYLYKQKHGKCKAWVKRYFVLYGEELRYFKSKSDTSALAVISLDHYSLVPDAQPLTSMHSKQWKPHSFCLVSDDETKYDWPDYYLQASSDLERLEWVNLLERFVSQSSNVLEKWLDRFNLKDDMPVISLQTPTSNPFIPSKSFDSLPSSNKPTIIKRRPSDYLLSTTRSLMSSSSSSSSSSSIIMHMKENKLSKLLTSFKSKSSSSVLSSTTDSQEEEEYTPNIAVEVPIINPKDFDNAIIDPTTHFYYNSK